MLCSWEATIYGTAGPGARGGETMIHVRKSSKWPQSYVERAVPALCPIFVTAPSTVGQSRDGGAARLRFVRGVAGQTMVENGKCKSISDLERSW